MMAEQNSRPIVILSHTSAARCGAAAITSHNRCPQFRLAIQDGDIEFDRAVAPNGTATAAGSLAPLCNYRTNYGKITSIRDRLFQLIKSRRIFASFDVFRLALSILLTLDETKKTKVSTAFLTAVRRGNDVRLTWAS